MSYILEALKKAEAERQLGATPTLHAPMLAAGAPRAGGLRKPVVAAVGAMGVVIVVLAVVVWRQAATPAPALAVAAAPAPVAPAPLPSVKPEPVTVARAPAVTEPAKPEPAKAEPPKVEPAKVEPAKPEPAKPEPAKPETRPAADDPVQTLRDLPEPIRRAIPTYSMDGYMYSPNPADRLILIDKVLRHEGEEVAPGLVLEKLLPKGAVFSFRGYRYRVTF